MNFIVSRRSDKFKDFFFNDPSRIIFFNNMPSCRKIRIRGKFLPTLGGAIDEAIFQIGKEMALDFL